METSTEQGHDSGRIFRNAAWMLLAQIVTWAAATAQAVVLPRAFGAEVAGHLHIGLSLWAIVGLFVTFGTDVALARRIARTIGTGRRPHPALGG